MNVLGVMSGTSMDGADGVLVRFGGGGTAPHTWEVLTDASRPYDGRLRERLVAAIRPGGADAPELTQLAAWVGEHVADLVQSVQDAGYAVDLVAMSGQTVWHEPVADRSSGTIVATLQLGEPTRVVARCDVPVVSDLRQGDVAEGGQGAPMVSFADHALLSVPGRARTVHNLGGIGNLTWLPPDGDPRRVLAFDTGPANCLMDELATRATGATMDEGGVLAARGRVHDRVLERLMAHPYLDAPPPKTTGREAFNLVALSQTGLTDLPVTDGMATALAFTVASTVRAYRDHVLERGLDEVVLAGGGARNPVLVERLTDALGALGTSVTTFEALGMRSAWREAVAFALMGYEAWFGRPNVLPSATGARRAACSGSISRPAVRL